MQDDTRNFTQFIIAQGHTDVYNKIKVELCMFL